MKRNSQALLIGGALLLPLMGEAAPGVFHSQSATVSLTVPASFAVSGLQAVDARQPSHAGDYASSPFCLHGRKGLAFSLYTLTSSSHAETLAYTSHEAAFRTAPADTSAMSHVPPPSLEAPCVGGNAAVLTLKERHARTTAPLDTITVMVAPH